MISNDLPSLAEKNYAAGNSQAAASLCMQELAEEGITAYELATLAEKVFADGRTEVALTICTEALKRDPDEPLALNNKAVLLAAIGKTKEAIDLLQRAINISQEGRSYLERMALCWETILDPNKSKDAVCGLDDKWCFPRPTFERFATEAGFASCRFIVPKPVVTFTNQTLRTIPLAIPGADRGILPEWCWAAFYNMDKLANGPLFDEMASNALVILET